MKSLSVKWGGWEFSQPTKIQGKSSWNTWLTGVDILEETKEQVDALRDNLRKCMSGKTSQHLIHLYYGVSTLSLKTKKLQKDLSGDWPWDFLVL